MVVAASDPLSPFLQRLHRQGLGQIVVLHTGRRSYVGELVAVGPASVQLDAESDELEGPCRLEVAPERIEAFEILPE
jgi:hypothetical protein